MSGQQSIVSPAILASIVDRAERAPAGDDDFLLRAGQALPLTTDWGPEQCSALAALLPQRAVAWLWYTHRPLMERNAHLVRALAISRDELTAEIRRHQWRWDRSAGREPMPPDAA